MKNKILLLIMVLIGSTNIYATTEDKTGDIALSLSLGGGDTNPINATFTPKEGGSGNNINLATTDSNGARYLDYNIGTLSLSAPKIEPDTTCIIYFQGGNNVGTDFSLKNSKGDAIPYQLKLKIKRNKGAVGNYVYVNAGTTDANNPAQVKSIANGNNNGFNKCDIDITELRIFSSANLANKTGDFEDTLTYIMSVI